MTMETNKHFLEIGKDIILYGLLAGIAQMGNLLLLPIFTRFFSVEEYGIIDLIATFVSFLSIAIKVALPSALARYFKEEENIPTLVTSSLLCIFVVGITSIFCIYLFCSQILPQIYHADKYKPFIMIGSWIAFLNALVSIPQMVLRLKRKVVLFNIVNFLSTGLYMLFSLMAISFFYSGLISIFFAQILSAGLTLFLALILIRNEITNKISLTLIKKALKFSIPLLPAVIFTWANLQVDRIVLLYFNGLSGVAIYGAASKITKICQFLTFVFRQAWHPYSMLIIKAQNRDDIYRRVLNYYSGIFSIIGLGFVAISPELFSLLVPVKYQEGVVLVPWLLGALILHQTASITNLGIVVSERTFGITVASLGGGIINLILSYILINRYGVIGAAIGTFIAELFFTVSLWQLSKVKSKLRIDAAELTIVLLVYVVSSILLMLCGKIESQMHSILYRILITFVSSAIILFETIEINILNRIKKSINFP